VRLSLVADSVNALVGALAAQLVLGLAGSRCSPEDHIVGMPGLRTGPLLDRNFEGLLVDNGTHDASPSLCTFLPMPPLVALVHLASQGSQKRC
jgi:hypothetical protein